MKKKNKFIIFFLLACISLFSCSSNEEEVIVYEKIIESSFDIDIKNVNLKGFKLGKNYDIKLDCITISKKQYEYSKERIHKEGLNEKE